MWLHYLVKHNMCQTVHNHSNTIIKRHGKVTVTRTNTITTKCSMCFPLALTPTLRWSHHWLIAWSITLSCSVRFVKKKHWGSPTGERVEAPQAPTCNTNTGVRIDPHELKSTETRGSKNHWEGWTPQPLRQIGPCCVGFQTMLQSFIQAS